MSTSARSSLVIVGAGLAGVRAAESARNAGHDGSIVLVGAETALPYERPQVTKEALLAGASPRHYVEHDQLVGRLGVQLRLGTRATGLDRRRRLLRTSDGKIGYDALVVATGAQPTPCPWGNLDGQVSTVRTARDAVLLHRVLTGRRRVVVVGAGLIGSEIASAAQALGAEVTLVERGCGPLEASHGRSLAEHLARLHRTAGTRLVTGAAVTSLVRAGASVAVDLGSGERIVAEHVVWAVGVRSDLGWLVGSGIRVAEGVLCTTAMVTNDPAVFVAGDAAQVVATDGPQAAPRSMSQSMAAAQGLVAGHNAVTPPGSWSRTTATPYFWSTWYDRRIQGVGVPSARSTVLQEGGGTLHLYEHRGRLTGAVGIDAKASVRRVRELLREGSSSGAHAAREMTGRPA